MRNINKFFLILILLFFKTTAYGSENFYNQAVDKFNDKKYPRLKVHLCKHARKYYYK